MSYPASTMTVGGTCGGARPARGPDRPAGRPGCIPPRRVRPPPPRKTTADPGGPRSVSSRTSSSRTARRSAKAVADVRIVVETAAGELDRRGSDRRGRASTRSPSPSRGPTTSASTPRRFPEGVTVPEGETETYEDVHRARQQQHDAGVLPRRGPAPGREQVEPAAPDARQRLEAGDDHRHHVDRAVADLRHDRAVQLRPRRDGHVRRADRLGVQPQLGFVDPDRRRARRRRRHGGRSAAASSSASGAPCAVAARVSPR